MVDTKPAYSQKKGYNKYYNKNQANRRYCHYLISIDFSAINRDLIFFKNPTEVAEVLLSEEATINEDDSKLTEISALIVVPTR